MDLAEQVDGRHPRSSRQTHGLDRLVMVWCGSTEIFIDRGAGACSRLENFEQALEDERSGDSAEHGLRLRGAEARASRTPTARRI